MCGSSYADQTSGEAGNDLPSGDTLGDGFGNGVLVGGGRANTMMDGVGNDTFCVDTATHVIVETAGNGTADRAAALTLATVSMCRV